MIVLLSPAKSIDMLSESPIDANSQPYLLNESKILIDQLRGIEKDELKKLMGISDKLAELNIKRYHQWSTPFTVRNAKASIFAFQGDVYQGFDASSLTLEELNEANKTVRILTGLYGILKPFDLMQAYRLEMGTVLANEKGKNLYEFWGSKITDLLNDDIAIFKPNIVLNLASVEYAKSVQFNKLNVDVVSPVFKDEKNGNYKIISFYAKQARGKLAREVVKRTITTLEELKNVAFDGYSFNQKMTDNENEPTFSRSEEALASMNY